LKQLKNTTNKQKKKKKINKQKNKTKIKQPKNKIKNRTRSKASRQGVHRAGREWGEHSWSPTKR
jgi:hypothetical protein